MKVITELFQDYADQCISEFGVDERLFALGGCGVRIRFCGERWAGTLTKALDHLCADTITWPANRELTVYILDGSVSPRNPLLRFYLKPLVDFWPELTGPRGELRYIHGGPIAAFYQPGPDLLSIVDLEANVAFYWKRDLTPPPYYEVGSPMRTLLHAWLIGKGVQFVHGAAIGTEAGGVLLAGKGGSGKSTSALACLNSSLKYASDDYCMVTSPEDNPARVYSLYNTAKLVGSEDLTRFAGLERHVWNPVRGPSDKVTIFLHQSFPEKIITDFPLRAILLPRVSGGVDTQIERCGEGAAAMALGPSSMAQLPHSGSRDLAFIARLVRRFPCYRLNVGTDLSQIPDAIGRLLEQLPS